MKFGRKLKNLMVPEWSEYYLNYKALKTLLSPFKIMNTYYIKEEISLDNFQIENFKNENEKLKHFNSEFEKLLYQELEKINAFYKDRLRDLIEKWRLLKINAIIIKNAKARVDYEEKKAMLKMSFQLFYKQIRLLNEYISLNLEAFSKILKKHRKFTKQSVVSEQTENVKTKFEEEVRKRDLTIHQEYLQNLVIHTEQDYLDIFYIRKDRKMGQLELRKIYQGKLINQNESFFFGFFFGLTIFCICLTATLFWVGSLSIEDDPEFKAMFPVFRGVGLFIIYLWLLGFNVYGWTVYNINYKLIFNFSYHYSNVVEILNRAAFFTAIFLFMFLWFIILRQEIGDLAAYIDFIPMTYSGMIVWILFLGYIFFPSEHFNPQGRAYTYKLFKDIFASVLFPSSFRVTWATDQLLSFVIPLKDLEYTICYYLSTFDDQEECQHNDRFTGAVIMALIPLLLRFLQSVRQMVDNSNYRHIFLMNGLKYLLSIISVIFSYCYLAFDDEIFFVLWVVMCVILVPFTIIWDLKMDWGFLVDGSKNRFLRDDLAYTDLRIYYTDVVLRFLWVLSISPGILTNAGSSEVAVFAIGATEIMRRNIWNFLRVEREHLMNCGAFKATEDLIFPYQDVEILGESDNLFRNELANLIQADGKNQDDGYKDAKLKKSKSGEHIKVDKFKDLRRLNSNLHHQIDLSAIEKLDVNALLKEVREFKEYLLEKINLFYVDPLEEKAKLNSIHNRN